MIEFLLICDHQGIINFFHPKPFNSTEIVNKAIHNLNSGLQSQQSLSSSNVKSRIDGDAILFTNAATTDKAIDLIMISYLSNAKSFEKTVNEIIKESAVKIIRKAPRKYEETKKGGEIKKVSLKKEGRTWNGDKASTKTIHKTLDFSHAHDASSKDRSDEDIDLEKDLDIGDGLMANDGGFEMRDLKSVKGVGPSVGSSVFGFFKSLTAGILKLG